MKKLVKVKRKRVKKKVSESRLNESKIVIDVVDDDIDVDDWISQMEKKYGIEGEVLNRRGPGGGWPEVSFTGPKEKLKKFFTSSDYGGDEGDFSVALSESRKRRGRRLNELDRKSLENIDKNKKSVKSVDAQIAKKQERIKKITAGANTAAALSPREKQEVADLENEIKELKKKKKMSSNNLKSSQVKASKVNEAYDKRGKQDGSGPYKGSAQKGRGPMAGKKAGLYTKAQLARLKKWYNVDTNEEALERAISDVKKGREPLKDSYKRKGDTGEEGVKKLDKKTMDRFRKANESKNSLEDVLDKDISKKKLNERLINMSFKRFSKNVEFEFLRASKADNTEYPNNLDRFSRELGKIFTKYKKEIKYFIVDVRKAFRNFEKLKELKERNPNRPLMDIEFPWKEADVDEEIKRNRDAYERNMKGAYYFFKKLPGKIQNRFFIINTRTKQEKFF